MVLWIHDQADLSNTQVAYHLEKLLIQLIGKALSLCRRIDSYQVDISLASVYLRDKAKQKGLDSFLELADKTGIVKEFAKEMVNGFPFLEFRPSSLGDYHTIHKVSFLSVSN